MFIISNWSISDSILHNVILIVVLFFVALKLIRWIKRTPENIKNKKTVAHIMNLVLGLGFYYLIGSVLFLLEDKNFEGLLFTGWFWSDLTLKIVYSVSVIIFVFAIYMVFKNKSKIKSKMAVVSIISMVIILGGNFFILCFNNIPSHSTITLDSEVYITEQGTLVTKMRKSTPNGTSRGISYSHSSFGIFGVNLDTGENTWNKSSIWQEYIVGNTREGLLVVNTKKEDIYFLDSNNGEVVKDKSFLEKEYNLQGILSYKKEDYVIDGDSIYLYGLDGRYYYINLNTHEKKVDSSYKEKFTEDFLKNAHKDMGIGYPEKNVIEGLYNDLIDVKVLEVYDDYALIVHLTRRDGDFAKLSKVDLNKNNIYWSIDFEYSEDCKVRSKDKYNVLISNNKMYSFDINSGNVDYIYDYLYNKIDK